MWSLGFALLWGSFAGVGLSVLLIAWLDHEGLKA